MITNQTSQADITLTIPTYNSLNDLDMQGKEMNDQENSDKTVIEAVNTAQEPGIEIQDDQTIQKASNPYSTGY